MLGLCGGARLFGKDKWEARNIFDTCVILAQMEQQSHRRKFNDVDAILYRCFFNFLWFVEDKLTGLQIRGHWKENEREQRSQQ